MKILLTVSSLLSLLVTVSAQAQVRPDVWRTFAQNVGIGSEVNVRLHDGTRFRATLVGVQDDALLVQPKTRVTVPVQAIRYADIASLERRKAGVGAGKAAAIGVATGVGSFFAMFLILIAAVAGS